MTMNYPPIFALCDADPVVSALLGDSDTLRVFLFGAAPEAVQRPYMVWQTVGGIPDNVLAGVPQSDAWTVQVDLYGVSASEVRAAADAVRDALEPSCYVSSWRGEGYEHDTRLWRFSFDVQFSGVQR